MLEHTTLMNSNELSPQETEGLIISIATFMLVSYYLLF